MHTSRIILIISIFFATYSYLLAVPTDIRTSVTQEKLNRKFMHNLSMLLNRLKNDHWLDLGEHKTPRNREELETVIRATQEELQRLNEEPDLLQ